MFRYVWHVYSPDSLIKNNIIFPINSFDKEFQQLISLQSKEMLVPVLTDVDSFSFSTATVN